MAKKNLTIFDVTAAVFQDYQKQHPEKMPITPAKLEMLVYYSKAWSLVFDIDPLYDQRFYATTNRPVQADLDKHHSKHKNLREYTRGKANRLNEEQSKTIGFVVRNYGPLSTSELKKLVRKERPMKNALKRVNHNITDDDMEEYYISLV